MCKGPPLYCSTLSVYSTREEEGPTAEPLKDMPHPCWQWPLLKACFVHGSQVCTQCVWNAREKTNMPNHSCIENTTVSTVVLSKHSLPCWAHLNFWGQPQRLYSGVTPQQYCPCQQRLCWGTTQQQAGRLMPPLPHAALWPALTEGNRHFRKRNSETKVILTWPPQEPFFSKEVFPPILCFVFFFQLRPKVLSGAKAALFSDEAALSLTRSHPLRSWVEVKEELMHTQCSGP